MAVDDFLRILSTSLQDFKCFMYHRIFDKENRLDEAMFLYGSRAIPEMLFPRISWIRQQRGGTYVLAYL